MYIYMSCYSIIPVITCDPYLPPRDTLSRPHRTSTISTLGPFKQYQLCSDVSILGMDFASNTNGGLLKADDRRLGR